MPKPKNALELKHELDQKINKARTALRKHQKTPEGIKQAADSAWWSETCRAQWMALEAARTEIRRMLPRKPVLVVTGGRTFCETHDVSGKEVKPLSEALDERRDLAWVLDTIDPSKIINGGAADLRGIEGYVIPAGAA